MQIGIAIILKYELFRNIVSITYCGANCVKRSIYSDSAVLETSPRVIVN